MTKTNPAAPAQGGRLADFGRLLAYAWRRFQSDRCLRVAASLSYTTLLALVPLLTIGFAMFSAFPVFEDVEGRVQTLIFENMVPELGSVVQDQFASFVANTGSLTAIGLVVLGVTALMMFNTVENAFNVIWRARRRRALALRLVIFWAVLTIGPLLMGASITLSTYIFTLTRVLDIEAFTGPLGRLVRLLPFVLEIAMFSILYLVLPNRRVNWRHALVGGLVAAVLFEILKKSFALYIANFPAQQTIYGALSTIPLFLVWMYVSWSAVLVGAEVAASLPEYRLAVGDAGARRQQLLSIALRVLGVLAIAARDGNSRRQRELGRELALDEGFLEPVLEQLTEVRYVARTDSGGWMLARDLDRTSLYDLLRDLELTISAGNETGATPAAWDRRLTEIVARGEAAQREAMSDSLRHLLETDAGDTAQKKTAPQKKRGFRRNT